MFSKTGKEIATYIDGGFFKLKLTKSLSLCYAQFVPKFIAEVLARCFLLTILEQIYRKNSFFKIANLKGFSNFKVNMFLSGS